MSMRPEDRDLNDGGQRLLFRMQLALKAVLAASIGLFGLLVGYTNIVDYQANWQFVQGVLEMQSFEDWFDPTAIEGRAITSVPVQRFFYASIIAAELLAGAFFMAGGIWMAIALFRQRSAAYGKALAVAGGTMAVLLWYTGFAVIGAEYFAMWASAWDGQTKAYTFVTFVLLAVMYISRPE